MYSIYFSPATLSDPGARQPKRQQSFSVPRGFEQGRGTLLRADACPFTRLLNEVTTASLFCDLCLSLFVCFYERPVLKLMWDFYLLQSFWEHFLGVHSFIYTHAYVCIPAGSLLLFRFTVDWIRVPPNKVVGPWPMQSVCVC